MIVISHIFSFLCNQDPFRSFEIAGHLLPLCQRCTGLYTGMGLSFLWLLLNRFYKKGLPPRSVVYVNIMCLLIMPVFGFHILDPGPAWRFWSGLIYGNAIVSLFLPAALIIYNKDKKSVYYMDYSTRSFWIFFIFLNSLPIWFPIQSEWFYCLVLLLILTGMPSIITGVLVVSFSIIKKLVKPTILKGLYYEPSKSKYNYL